ncbi:hypothetical protein [Hyphobacterium marinum]|uniref:Uncharacterized protein n=1 Tax=Hyphobacterium marinum TaxID=3116574 RepID=A0ABU7M0A9_9PROT|nr:hypothetical protein [Hyphobacterium sp. Y6023]MEE2567247.1 hypothetical protein [Hyphobacterium sp. Y6023]
MNLNAMLATGLLAAQTAGGPVLDGDNELTAGQTDIDAMIELIESIRGSSRQSRSADFDRDFLNRFCRIIRQEAGGRSHGRSSLEYGYWCVSGTGGMPTHQVYEMMGDLAPSINYGAIRFCFAATFDSNMVNIGDGWGNYPISFNSGPNSSILNGVAEGCHDLDFVSGESPYVRFENTNANLWSIGTWEVIRND